VLLRFAAERQRDVRAWSGFPAVQQSLAAGFRRPEARLDLGDVRLGLARRQRRGVVKTVVPVNRFVQRSEARW